MGRLRKPQAAYPYAVVTTKNPFYAKSSHFRRLVEFNNVDHARNYCRKAVKPEWYQYNGQTKNANNIVKITVRIDADTCWVWTKGNGWNRWMQ